MFVAERSDGGAGGENQNRTQQTGRGAHRQQQKKVGGHSRDDGGPSSARRESVGPPEEEPETDASLVSADAAPIGQEGEAVLHMPDAVRRDQVLRRLRSVQQLVPRRLRRHHGGEQQEAVGVHMHGVQARQGHSGVVLFVQATVRRVPVSNTNVFCAENVLVHCKSHN